jgi:hypothetical protein
MFKKKKEKKKKSAAAGEETPLLATTAAKKGGGDASEVAFRRQTAATCSSVRGSIAFPYFPSAQSSEGTEHGFKKTVEPAEALSNLAVGGVIVVKQGDDPKTKKYSKPLSIGKSIPAVAPYRRKARHRSFTLVRFFVITVYLSQSITLVYSFILTNSLSLLLYSCMHSGGSTSLGTGGSPRVFWCDWVV